MDGGVGWFSGWWGGVIRWIVNWGDWVDSGVVGWMVVWGG